MRVKIASSCACWCRTISPDNPLNRDGKARKFEPVDPITKTPNHGVVEFPPYCEYCKTHHTKTAEKSPDVVHHFS